VSGVKSETPEMNHSRFELVLILKFEMEMDVDGVDGRDVGLGRG
jgi:hypothetical protein